MYIPKETFVSLSKKIENRYPRWMPHRFRKPRKTLLFGCYL